MSLSTLYIDFNSYFASVEQHLRPELRGRPVAVIPVDTDATSVIAASVEAKRHGVRTGTKVVDAKRLCPGIVLVLTRTREYVRVHHELVRAVDAVIPVHAVHSIDEMSCLLARDQREPDAAVRVAQRVKDSIATRCGETLRCSIGVAPNRFLSKVASDMVKPDGLTVIRREDLPHALHRLSLSDLPGVGPRMLARLNAAGITSVESLCARSEHELRAVWKSVLASFWFRWLKGEETIDLFTPSESTRRSIGHQHVLPPQRRTEEGARAVLVRLATKAGTRARALGYAPNELSVWARFTSGEKWHDHARLNARRDTHAIIEAMARLWDQRRVARGVPARIVGVTLHNLESPNSATLPLFEGEQRLNTLWEAIDKVNARLGTGAVYLASMQEAKKAAQPRIAFRSIPGVDDFEEA